MDPSDGFLGTGWAFPPDFSTLARSVRMTAGVQNIKESLQILLHTSPGERVMVPDYGTDLAQFAFSKIDTTTMHAITETVGAAICLWEPRVELLSVEPSIDSEPNGLLMIEIEFRVRSTNALSNFVFPLYVAQPELGTEPSA